MHFTLHQSQHLIVSHAMEQAFQVLKMPIEELLDYIESCLESNPLIELTPTERGLDTYSERAEVTLYEHLMMQCRLSGFDLERAEALVGNLDERGFYTEAIVDREMMEKIRSLEPKGVGASNVQECLLLQLEKGLAYRLIETCYQDLLHGRMKKISQTLKISVEEVKRCIQEEIRPLNPFPGLRFAKGAESLPSIDLVIQEEVMVTSPLPTFRLRSEYALFAKTRFYRKYLAESKWLIRSVQRRESILKALGLYLTQKHRAFFAGEGPLKGESMKEAARQMGLSEASLTRAVAGKWASTPVGIMRLKDFFSLRESKKEQLKRLILQENKECPLSDEVLANQLGIARRTVAKYREELLIPPKARRLRKM